MKVKFDNHRLLIDSDFLNKLLETYLYVKKKNLYEINFKQMYARTLIIKRVSENWYSVLPPNSLYGERPNLQLETYWKLLSDFHPEILGKVPLFYKMHFISRGLMNENTKSLFDSIIERVSSGQVGILTNIITGKKMDIWYNKPRKKIGIQIGNRIRYYTIKNLKKSQTGWDIDQGVLKFSIDPRSKKNLKKEGMSDKKKKELELKRTILFNNALKMVPNSPRQLKLWKEIQKLNRQLGIITNRINERLLFKSSPKYTRELRLVRVSPGKAETVVQRGNRKKLHQWAKLQGLQFKFDTSLHGGFYYSEDGDQYVIK